MTTVTSSVSAEEREDFIRGYTAALLWTATNEEGEPLDADFTVDDFSDQARAAIAEDCDDFLESFGEIIRGLDYGQRGSEWSNFELAGHDFLLTRQGHGVGFWDRGLGEVGDHLTAMSKPYGDTYVWASEAGYNTLEVE